MSQLALQIAQELVSRASVTPNDAGCQEHLITLLEPLGFTCHRLQYGEVSNLWATRGSGAPLTVYLGHTDVVPSGANSQWESAPFTPTIRNGYLYGRGSADMKGSVACFVAALHTFLEQHDTHKGTIGVLITSDEEALAIDGIRRVVSDYFTKNSIQIDYCLVGEPTSEHTLFDTIKNGRRGSLNGTLTIKGKQGHIAYPHFALNPVSLAAPWLQEVTKIQWDKGNQYFEPTGFEISNINAGTGAANVIPGEISITFNFRYNTEHTMESLQQRMKQLCDRHGFNYTLTWEHSGAPFLAKADGALVKACKQAAKEHVGKTPELSTSGGTSDGRFIAPTGAETVEFGGLSKTIHQANERIGLDEIEALTIAYTKVLKTLAT